MDIAASSRTAEARPSEVHTFLIADVRGYTHFTVEHGDEAAAQLTIRFAELAREVSAARDGQVIELRGDEALAVFASARQALRAAVDLQARVAQEIMPLGVGVGLDAGEAVPVAGGYRGAALNLAARLCGRAGSGEVLASEGVIHLARKVEGLAYLSRGQMALQGFDEPVSVLQVVREETEPVTPAGAVEPSGPTAFGRLLQRYRVAAELTQEELAERAGLSVRGISDLERGLSKAPRLATFRQLADALQLSPHDRARLQAAAQGTEGPIEAGANSTATSPSAAESPTQQLPAGGFLGSLPSGPFVARDRELSKIMAAADAAASGAGRLVMLAGEPGVGKTRLAQEVTLHVHQRGFLVAAGRCYEPEQTVPYFPFLEALGHLHTACPRALQGQVRSRWPYLARLLPDDGNASPSAGSGAEEQQRLLRTATGFVEAVSQAAPVALLLDDLHWADQASLSLLLHLVRNIHSSRVLVLATYRDVDVPHDHPLWAALRDLDREQLVERVSIHPLAEGETAALLSSALGTWISEEFVQLVHRRTEGNPFFVQQLLRALVERGDVYWQDGDWARRAVEEIEVPESVRAVIGQRLSHLAPPTHAVLQEASVIGQVFEFDTLQDVHQRGRDAGPGAEEELEAALEEAAGAGLVREAGIDAFGFDHALTQQTLYGELSARRRQRLHVAVAEALESARHAGSRKGQAADLLRHYLEGNQPERAITYALLAGDQAGDVFAHAEAERHYRTALTLAAQVEDAGREAAALEKLGEVLYTMARYDEALEVLERAAERYAALGDPEGERRTVAQIGHVHYNRESFPEGTARLQRALVSLGGGEPTEGLAALHTALAFLFFHGGRYGEQLSEAQRAFEVAQAVGNDRLLARAGLIRGYALGRAERQAEFQPAMEQVVELGERSGDLATAALALGALVGTYADAGELEQARTCAARALDIQERLGDQSRVAFATFVRGLVGYWCGAWSEARTDFQRSLELYQRIGAHDHAMIPTFGLGMVCMGQGDWAAGTAYLEEHITAARRTGDLRWVPAAEVRLAGREILEGEPATARARIEAALDLPGLAAVDRASLHAALAWACLELGDQARAARLVEGALCVAELESDRWVSIEARRVQGLVLARQGRWEEAGRSFEDALALTDHTTYPYPRARVLYDYGVMLVQQGEKEQGRSRLAEGLVICRRLGARKDAERTQGALAALDQI